MSQVSMCEAPPQRKKRIVDFALPPEAVRGEAVIGCNPASPRLDAMRKVRREVCERFKRLATGKEDRRLDCLNSNSRGQQVVFVPTLRFEDPSRSWQRPCEGCSATASSCQRYARLVDS